MVVGLACFEAATRRSQGDVSATQPRSTFYRSVSQSVTYGQSYKASMIVIYETRVVPDLKIAHITTLGS